MRCKVTVSDDESMHTVTLHLNADFFNGDAQHVHEGKETTNYGLPAGYTLELNIRVNPAWKRRTITRVFGEKTQQTTHNYA